MNDERKVFCRYCGGEIRTVICDDEGNIHDDEYLKNPFSGVGYKLAHDLSDVPDGVKCPICTFDDEITSIGTWIYDTAEEAYAAVTRRPPNRPLTTQQIENSGVQDNDAVWIMNRIKENAALNLIDGYGLKQLMWECRISADTNTWVWLRNKPTPEDIEAARLHSDC